MRNVRWAPAVLALALVLAATTAWYLRTRPAGDGTPVAALPDNPRVAGTQAAAAAEPARQLPPLPAGDQAVLPPRLRDLVARADGGDRRAACRLGSLLSHCRLVHPQTLTDEYIAGLRKSEDDFASRGKLSAANEAATMILNLTTLRRQCDGIPPSLSGRAPAYLRQAALAGEPEAMVRYLRGDAFVGLGAVDSGDLLGPDFDQWRREAPALLQAQLASGRPEAALLLLEAHSRLGTTLSFITPEDPLRDQAYLRLAQRLFEDFELPDYWMADEPGPDLAGDADALAREWQERFFQDRRFRISTDLVGLGNALVPDGESTWPAAERWRPACAEPQDAAP